MLKWEQILGNKENNFLFSFSRDEMAASKSDNEDDIAARLQQTLVELDDNLGGMKQYYLWTAKGIAKGHKARFYPQMYAQCSHWVYGRYIQIQGQKLACAL